MLPADSLRPPYRELLYYQTCPDFPKPRTTMRTLSAFIVISLAVAPSAFAFSATETDAARTAF